MQAAEIIEKLDLKPHPEGGWYGETFRDQAGPDGRARCTAIHFLLQAGEISHWHRVDATEIWFWHAGAPLELEIAEGEARASLVLGPDLAIGQTPHGVVPAGAWQSARSTGEFTLVSCTVAPGFEFSGFELAAPGWTPDQD